MDLVTGLAVLFVGVALAWGAEPGRLPLPLPGRAVRGCGLLAMLASAWWFVGPGGIFVGVVQYAIGLSLVASAIALAGPLHPRVAPVAAGCAAVLAIALELAR